MPEIVAIRPGRYRDSSGTERAFTEADLEATAAAYDPGVHEAPVVVGHPKHDAPAYGWIKGVRFDGGALTLEADRINPDFAEMHRSGAFRKHSIAFYPPDDPRNPKPGVWYPRHIGFLGATPPAIKGLPQTEFADGDKPVVIEFGELDGEGLIEHLQSIFRRLRDLITDKFGREEADRTISSFDIDDLPARALREEQTEPEPTFSEDPEMPEEPQTPEERADLEAREVAIAEREQRLAEQEAERRRAAAAEFAESLADAGRILPRHQPIVTELMLALPAEEVEFAEGDQTRTEQPEKLFREFLESLPKAIEFGEKSADDLPDVAADIELPPGCVPDPARMETYRKAKAYQIQNKCEFSEAVQAVTTQ